MKMWPRLLRWIARNPKPESPHPYAAEIAACKSRGLFFNNATRGCTFTVGEDDDSPKPMPDGELGPQCDDLKPGERPIAQDDRWLYMADGRRLPLRAPRSGGVH